MAAGDALMARTRTPASPTTTVTRHGHGHADDEHRRQQHRSWRSGCSSSSECLFFGAFIATYFLYRGRDAQYLGGPTPDDLFNIPFTSVTSFILLMSSLTMVLALAAIQRGDHRRLPHLAARHRALRADVHRRPGLRVHRVLPRGPVALARTCSARRSSCSPGLHGAHVTVGIIWLLSLWGRSMQGKLEAEHSEAVEIAGLYWHFVDIVWIVIFTAIYLIPQTRASGDDTMTTSRRPGTAAAGRRRSAPTRREHGLSVISPDEVPLLPGEEHSHPSPFQYVLIAVVLCVSPRSRSAVLPRGRPPTAPDHRAAARDGAGEVLPRRGLVHAHAARTSRSSGGSSSSG